MLYNKLPSKDLETFISYVQYYGPSADSEIYYPNKIASAEMLLRYWAASKEILYKAFGEQFILEKEITYMAPRSQIARRFGEAMEYGGKMYAFWDRVNTYALNKWHRWSDEVSTVHSLFNTWSLGENKADTLSPMELEFENGDKIKFDHRTKVLKMLGRIAKSLGPDAEKDFEEFRLEHSRILNQKKLTGTLCLSIHPMDYITMSDNSNGWSSCMSWQEDGDYRMGTVEMMNSPNVIVAYLKSDNRSVSWGGNKNSWNSKMWRTLLIADPKLLISIKAYPYENKDMSTTALEWVRELVNTNCGWKFPRSCEELRESSSNLWGDNEYTIRCDCGSMYNDFNACTHWGTIAEDAPKHISIYYSGVSECMWCGCADPDNYETHFVIGSCCCDGDGHRYCCEECGTYMHEDYVYWVGDCPLCEDCYERLTIRDDFDDEPIFKEESVEIYVSREKDNPNTKNDYYATVHESRIVSYHYNSHSYWSTFFKCAPHFHEEKEVYYWNLEDVTAEGLWRYYSIRNVDVYASTAEKTEP